MKGTLRHAIFLVRYYAVQINYLLKFNELVKSITYGARRKCPWGAK